MSARWAEVAIGEVADPVHRPVQPVPGETYRQVGVRWWGGGVYEREPVDGANTRYATFDRLEAGDIIFNKIWARHGGISVVQPSLTGCYCSGEFPLFRPRENLLSPNWFYWITKARWFWERCDLQSRGTSGKNRIRPEKFVQIRIPLPSLAEQRRIVEKIERLVAKVDEARAMRRDVAGRAGQLVSAEERNVWPDEDLRGAVPLASITTYLGRGRQSEQGDSDHFLIKTQHVQLDRYLPTTLRLAPHAALRVNPDAVVQEGDVLIACSAAGCLGRVASFRNDGRVASTDTHVAIARANRDVVEPDYLYAYLRGAQGQHQLRSRERGDWRREKIGFRLTELNLDDLRAVPVPVPAVAEQKRIVAKVAALRSNVAALVSGQIKVDELLAAFVPAILGRAFRSELG